MNLFSLKAAQTVERTDQGRLRLSVLTADRNQPIDDASVSISLFIHLRNLFSLIFFLLISPNMN